APLSVATGADDPSVRDADAVARGLGVDGDRGLGAAEVERRLAAHGPNRLRAVDAPPLWRRILAQFQDPLVYLLIGAVAIALAAWLAEGRQGWPIDALVIAAVLLLNAALGFIQESRAAGA